MNSPQADRVPVAPLTLLVAGGDGMLAHAVRAEAAMRGHRVVAFSRADLDVTDRASVHRALVAARPDAVLYCAAVSDLEQAEADPERAYAVNTEGAASAAAIAAGMAARFVYPSTDYVFDADGTRPCRPDDPVAPASVYARSKLEGEQAATRTGNALVVRTSWLFGVGRRPNLVSTVLARARAGERLEVGSDQRSRPTWTADLASVILSLLEQGVAPGVYHAANSGEATRYDVACAALRYAGLSAPVVPASGDVGHRAARPRYSVLDCSATEAIVGPIPHWRAALQKAIQAGL